MTVIADISVSSGDFVLGKTMQALPGGRIEVEQLVPSGALPLPYFWIEESDAAAAEAALREQSAVESVTRLDTLDDRVLLRVTWTEEVDSFLQNLIEYDAAILDAVGDPDEWEFQLRFSTYGVLSSFYRACIDDGVGVDLERVHNPVEAASNSRYGLTDDQERTLAAAFEGGYFEIPRGTTINELADDLGVSDSAVSQRLRRAQSSLVAATVMTAAERSLSDDRR